MVAQTLLEYKKQMQDKKNEALVAITKLALEYNAGLIAICTVYMGNMDTPRNQDKFLKEYKKFVKQYESDLAEVFKNLEKEIENEGINVQGEVSWTSW